MGWTFRTEPCTKKQIINECLNNISDMKLLVHSIKGNEVWSVWERPDNSRIITLFLLSSQKRCWGYKTIDEAHGPHYYKCPIKFLEMVSVTPHGNKDWRERVYEYHNNTLKNQSALKKIKVGAIVSLDVPGKEYRVTKVTPFRGVSLESGLVYRLIKSRVVAVKHASI